MELNKVEQVKAEKEPTGTEALQEGLQVMLQKHGMKASRQTAWKVFKDFIATVMITTLDQEDMRLPLSGVGTFEIQVLDLRKTHFSAPKEGEPEDVVKGKALTHNKTVKFNFRPSSRIVGYLEQNIEGVLKEEPSPDEVIYPFTTTPPPEEKPAKEPKPAAAPKEPKPAKPAAAPIEDF